MKIKDRLSYYKSELNKLSDKIFWGAEDNIIQKELKSIIRSINKDLKTINKRR